MTIQQCRYVLKVAETGSFNEAANSLFIAQSTLSLSIKALEDELGIKIFERQRNGVCFTDEGAEFVTDGIHYPTPAEHYDVELGWGRVEIAPTTSALTDRFHIEMEIADL